MGSLNRIDQTAPDAEYDSDFYAWSLDQAARIRAADVPGLDVANIAEEIESLGRSDKRELLSRFTVLIGHLLKWTFQPERRGTSWLSTILEQRLKINELLSESPSLNSMLPDIVSKAYKTSIRLTAVEIDMPASTFPARCAWPISTLLDESWMLPD